MEVKWKGTRRRKEEPHPHGRIEKAGAMSVAKGRAGGGEFEQVMGCVFMELVAFWKWWLGVLLGGI
jgi:hypothetical protein